MTDKNGSSYEFGSFVLDTTQNLLLRNGEQVRLPAKALELLLFFVRNPNRVIDKETLMREVWGDSFVEDANLAVHISNLRKTLNGDVNGITAIETFPKVGYRFNADVRTIGPEVRPSLVESGDQTDRSAAHFSETARPSDELPQEEKSFSAKYRSKVVGFLLLLVVLIGSGYALSKWFAGHEHTKQTISRVPRLEQSSAIALSPNGEYIAHSETKAGKYTLMMTNIGSGSSLRLLEPENSAYWGLTFSRDGSFLYFVRQGGDMKSLYKIPILGNIGTKILDNVGEKISFSPKGDRFAFVRRIDKDVTAIVTAKSDGTDEKMIATRTSPNYYSSFDLSWSPDGTMIANVVGNSKQNQSRQIVGVDVNSGEERLISDSKWSGSDGLDWLKDGSGLIAGLMETGGNSPTQVWFIPFPSGEPRRITNDLNNYGSVGVSNDGKTLMAGQFKDESRLWLVPNDGSGLAKPVIPGRQHLFRWIKWATNEKLVFGSSAGMNRDVWIMNSDGTGERRLTENTGNNVMPAASADGNHIVFVSNRQNESVNNLWRTSTSGEDPIQLTKGDGENQPVISPDSKWVYYTSGKIDGAPLERTVWRVPIDSGESVQVVREPSYAPDVSPDGKFLAVWYKPDNASPWKVALFPFDGGVPVKLLDVPPGSPVQWTPDGKGISYIKTVEAVSNIWVQPIDGNSPIQMTNFTSERISQFDWSPDGRLVCSRQSRTTDIVLIHNFR